MGASARQYLSLETIANLSDDPILKLRAVASLTARPAGDHEGLAVVTYLLGNDLVAIAYAIGPGLSIATCPVCSRHIELSFASPLRKRGERKSQHAVIPVERRCTTPRSPCVALPL
jgi:hypothetical protein